MSRRPPLATALLALALLVGACSDGDGATDGADRDAGSGTETTSAAAGEADAFCQAWAATQEAATGLEAEELGAVQDAMSEVAARAEEMVAPAPDEVAADVDDLVAATTALDTTVAAAGSLEDAQAALAEPDPDPGPPGDAIGRFSTESCPD